MIFSDMPYSRPDAEQLKRDISALTKKLSESRTYKEAKSVFLEKEELNKHIATLSTLAEIRQSLNAADEYYDAEKRFWNGILPELEEYEQEWTEAMLASPFRPDFSAEYGELMFVNAEIDRKTFSPEIIPLLQRESDAAMEYEKLLASAQIEFDGAKRSLPELEPYKTSPDGAVRLAAWKAEGCWFKANQGELDRLFDELVHLRDDISRALGHSDFTETGYYRMRRSCYTKQDVESFREAVVSCVVPLAESIYKKRAERLGLPYPLSFSDKAIEFKDGNPEPVLDSDGIVAAAAEFYEELSAETGEFFDMMRKNGLMDLLSGEGKASGGYCTSIPDYGVPFIFANFNGTQGDIEVVTHEAGHAFADYMNRDRIPMEYREPSYEACEVHSMSMEFFAWKAADRFFGNDAEKFRISHLSGAVTFIPYGTAVDHFQHIVYERPDLTPAERHLEWKRLLGIYMPWIALDGDIPFYGEGMDWQMKHHIYSLPFYYIDYCLAETVALRFWGLIQEDEKSAWDKYMKYTSMGGSRKFTELLSGAGLMSPFEGDCLKEVCERAAEYLSER